MNSTMPDADGATNDHDSPWSQPDSDGDPGAGRVVGGVASLIGDRLGLNPFWLRMGFVILTLAGGLGAVIYVGLWLTLILGDDEARRPIRIVGGAVMVIGILWLLGSGNTNFFSGTGAVVTLLIGLAVALWQPRTIPTVVPKRRPTDLPGRAPRPRRQRSPRRPPSLLGRAALGLAVVTAAVGALIDQANGGQLHPEQWLGAAAVVCGIGTLIGVMWGRARWLILPAAAFAATGYVGGVAAERGIALQNTGDHDVSADGGNAGEDVNVSFGNVDFSIYSGATPGIGNREVHVLVGDVRLTRDAIDDTSIELNWSIAHGTATIDGVTRPRVGSLHLGPNEPTALTIDVEIWRGDLTLWNQQSYEPEPTSPTFAPMIDTYTTVLGDQAQPSLSPVYVTDGVSATSDGFFLLVNGEAMIDNLDQAVVGDSSPRGDGVTEIFTSSGVFQLLPRGILLTPSNEVIDLHAWRARTAPVMTPPIAPAVTSDPTVISTADVESVTTVTTVTATPQDQSITTTTASTTTLPGG